MTLDNFVFQNPTKIYFGPNQLENLPGEIKKFGSRVMLTYGGGSIKKTGLFDKLVTVLENAGITVVEFGGIEPNPRHTTVNRGVALCKKENIDVLLAVGGGSTIDCTKAISVARYYDGDAWDLVTRKAPIGQVMPLLTVLTLAATGSEMDEFAVISNMDTNEKLGLGDEKLRPKVSFLDPTNTYTVSAFQTAAGSADIIAHIFDVCYFSRHEKMYMLDAAMESVLKTVVRYAPIALQEPTNYEVRANLMWASTWALNGFLCGGRGQATTCHAIEHELSAFYDITHGLGLAIIMPRWMEYVLDEKSAPDFKKFGVNVFGLPSNVSDMDGALAAISRFKKFLYEELHLQSSLSELHIDDTHFAAMARKACRNDVIHGYRDLAPVDVEAILRKCV